MIRKTVECLPPGTRLSVAHSQLVVERPDLQKATLPIADLGVVIVDDIRATYTQSVFLSLLEAGATVLVTGRDHLPAGMMLPFNAHHVQTERHRAQVEIGCAGSKARMAGKSCGAKNPPTGLRSIPFYRESRRTCADGSTGALG